MTTQLFFGQSAPLHPKQKHIFFFKRLIYYIYGEKFYKRFNYDWSKQPSRIQIIKEIIKKENYKKYKIPNIGNG